MTRPRPLTLPHKTTSPSPPSPPPPSPPHPPPKTPRTPSNPSSSLPRASQILVPSSASTSSRNSCPAFKRRATRRHPQTPPPQTPAHNPLPPSTAAPALRNTTPSAIRSRQPLHAHTPSPIPPSAFPIHADPCPTSPRRVSKTSTSCCVRRAGSPVRRGGFRTLASAICIRLDLGLMIRLGWGQEG